MSIDRFNKEEFEGVLSAIAQSFHVPWHRDGIQAGEYHYHFQARKFDGDLCVCIEVRSSIGRDGLAGAKGKDSIRLWFADQDGEPLGNKAKRWITRIPGWGPRLKTAVADLLKVAKLAKLCPDCGEIMSLFITKKDGPNKGRWFMKCMTHGHFKWLSAPKISADTPLCPECRSYMVLRKRRDGGGEFWGCSTYPDCRGTRSKNDRGNGNGSKPERKKKVVQAELPLEEEVSEAPITESEPVVESVPVTTVSEFVPSAFQRAIFDFIQNEQGNAVVEAVAGSGKTTTIVEALKFTSRKSNVAFVAFNRHIAKELAKRAPRHVKVSTLHSLGYMACRLEWGKNLKVDEDKVKKIMKRMLDSYTYGGVFSIIRKMVGLVKATLAGTTDEDFDRLADRYGIAMNGDREKIYEAVRIVIAECFNLRESVIDYDDMCWLPVVASTRMKQFDILFVDEAQDLNKCQVQLVLQSVKAGGRIIAVGDRNQSLYGFRGADTDAIPNLIKALEATVLPLSITYRCPKSHVKLAQTLVPEIVAADDADEGILGNVTYESFLSKTRGADLVLCRTNAPLVGPCFDLLRRGVKAVIRGRDIGKGLKALIRKMKATDIHSLLRALKVYEEREMDKLFIAGKNNQAQALQDKVETLIALATGMSTIRDIERRIDSVFSDDVEGVVFSSVHRAKGLESDRVFILKPEQMPHPMAKQPWEQVQERNVQYVAYTRSCSQLFFIGGSVYSQEINSAVVAGSESAN